MTACVVTQMLWECIHKNNMHQLRPLLLTSRRKAQGRTHMFSKNTFLKIKTQKRIQECVLSQGVESIHTVGMVTYTILCSPLTSKQLEGRDRWVYRSVDLEVCNNVLYFCCFFAFAWIKNRVFSCCIFWLWLPSFYPSQISLLPFSSGSMFFMSLIRKQASNNDII